MPSLPRALALACALACIAGCASRPKCDDGDHATVSFTLVNRGSQTLYLSELQFARKDGGEWVPFALDHLCQVLCSTCTNPCDGGCDDHVWQWCAPPLEALPPGAASDIDWDGRMYLTSDKEGKCGCDGSRVDCLEDPWAVTGEYRITVCHSPQYQHMDDECGEGRLVGNLIDPTCEDVFFTFDEEWCEEPYEEIPLGSP